MQYGHKISNRIEQTELNGNSQNYLTEAIVAETTNNKGESNVNIYNYFDLEM